MAYESADHRLHEWYEKRRRFATHAVLYIGFAVLCIIFFLNPAFWRQYMTLPNTGDLLIILAVWTVIFLSQLASFLVYERYQRALDRYEKPKRLRLDEDGEIRDSFDDETDILRHLMR
ncbi:MAG: hypothetical protein HZC41_20530 [Chloroflexi bacterium]|nr:hypothetical protein [Chloroflexota bacterium]